MKYPTPAFEQTIFTDVLMGVNSLFQQVEKNQRNDFLICLLDLISITFRPDTVPLSFTLAGNPDYFLDHLPDKSFRIKCFTKTSTVAGETMQDFWNKNDINMSFEKADKVFILVSGDLIIEKDFVVNALDFFKADFGGEATAKTIAGFGYDRSLLGLFRVSIIGIFKAG